VFEFALCKLNSRHEEEEEVPLGEVAPEDTVGEHDQTLSIGTLYSCICFDGFQDGAIVPKVVLEDRIADVQTRELLNLENDALDASVGLEF